MQAFLDARIINGDGKIYDGMTLLVEGSRLFGVIEKELVPSDATVVRLPNHVITPGLIDVHTHVGIIEQGGGVPGADHNETSSPSIPEARTIDGINPLEEGMGSAIESGITTVQVMPGSSNVIGGEMCILKPGGTVVDDMIVKAPSGMKAAFGENPKKVYGGSKGKVMTRMGIAALFRKKMIEAENYMIKRKKGGERNLGMEQLTKVLAGEIPFRIHAHRADDMATAIRLKKEFGFELTLEHGTEAHLIPEHILANDVSVSAGPVMASKSKPELLNKSWESILKLDEYDINFAITTDHPIVNIQHLVTSAAKAVQAGLSEKAAMKAITTNAAKHLGLGHRIGMLAEGMDADFVIWSGHPFDYRSKVKATYINGRKM